MMEHSLFSGGHFFDWADLIVQTLAILAAYALGAWQTRKAFERERKTRRDEERAEAFALLTIVSLEMRSLLGRVQYMRGLAKRKPVGSDRTVVLSKAPILTFARDAMLTRIVQLMPPGWSAAPIVDFYENAGIIEAHQALGIAELSNADRSIYRALGNALAFAEDKGDAMRQQYEQARTDLQSYADANSFNVDQVLYKDPEVEQMPDAEAPLEGDDR